MKRQVVLDTETTGLETTAGHRIIEIGCVELINRRMTGKTYHQYLNPEREIESAAEQVHGLTNEFLLDKPKFVDIFSEFINFVDRAELVIHNAAFDVGFINYEFKLLNQGLGRIEDSCTIIDTLQLARKLHPGQRNNLDALCKRYAIDHSNRKLHGGLLDAELLTFVYLAMSSGQENLFIAEHSNKKNHQQMAGITKPEKRYKLPVIKANATELAAHEARLDAIATLTEHVLWRDD